MTLELDFKVMGNYALDVLCAQLTRDLFAIAKFLFKQVHSADSGVATPSAARCGCQIFCPFVFGDTGEPTQRYSIHFLRCSCAMHSFLNAKKNKRERSFRLTFFHVGPSTTNTMLPFGISIKQDLFVTNSC